MRRVLIIAFAAVATAACDVDPRECQSQRDCFGGEICRDGRCVAASISLDLGGEDATLPDAAEPPADATYSDSGDCRFTGCGDQICNVTTGACEPCQRDRQCGDARICDRADGVCVCEPGHHACGDVCLPDDSPQSCGDRCEPCPHIENGSSTCVDGECGYECRPDAFDIGSRCVTCRNTSDCGDSARPVCVDGECLPCSTSADCHRFPETPVCDEGECVECVLGEEDLCAAYSCDPATRRCTDTLRSTRKFCEACKADSECIPNHRCVPMTFVGAARPDGYCLPQADDDCLSVSVVVSERDSLSGVFGEFYCVPREDLTTCEAIRDFRSPCEQDSDCGAAGVADGLCRTVDGDRQCTYRCATSMDCANATACIGNPPNNSYCSR